MTWFILDTWIVLIGATCAAACAIPGTFLVLRQMSMMGDAISHAVLPGLAVGFLLTGQRSSLVMFVAASIVGVFTAVFTQWISSFGKVDRGAAMGVVFTSLFAIGLLMIVQVADSVDLDPGCVLYGALEFTPLDVIFSVNFLGIQLDVPRAFVVLLAILALNIIITWIWFKEFVISSFDPGLAYTLSQRPMVMHYLLMVLVSVTAVGAFEAVGSVIVIAMLIVPASTAYLFSKSVGNMLWLSIFFAVCSAVLGHVSALVLPEISSFPGVSTAGMMAVMSGVLFFVAWCVNRILQTIGVVSEAQPNSVKADGIRGLVDE